MTAITFLVTTVLLAVDDSQIAALTGMPWLFVMLLHKAFPMLTIGCWTLFGPSRTVTWRSALLAALVPITYAAFALVRVA